MKFVAVLVVAAIAFVGHWADEKDKKHKAEIAAKVETKHVVIARTCVELNKTMEVAKAGSVGSAARINAVNSYFEKILSAPCVLYVGREVYSNPFSDTQTAKAKSREIAFGYRYALRSWNQIEPFKMQCADGWQSSSIGLRGACSWHGGEVSFFETDINYEIDSAFVPRKNKLLFKLKNHLELKN